MRKEEPKVTSVFLVGIQLDDDVGHMSREDNKRRFGDRTGKDKIRVKVILPNIVSYETANMELSRR